MATYTSNYAWTKPGGNDPVDISVLNGNLDSQDAIMHKAFGNMAQAFSQLSTYAVGDIVLYDNDLYKCHTAITVAGAWTGSTNWTSWTLAEGGGGGGTSDYTDLTNKPSINGVTLSGNKTTSDLGIDKTAVGLGNVPNVSTNDQTPTFSEASTRNNIASGEKLSVILGKIQKFFNDLKTVAFSGSYNDLTNKPSLATVATSGSYADLSNKPNAENILMSDGVTSVEDALDGLTSDTGWLTLTERIFYRKIDKIVSVRGTVLQSETGTNVATLPAGFRPVENYYYSPYPSCAILTYKNGNIRYTGDHDIAIAYMFIADN